MTFKVETSEKGTVATDVQVQVPVEEAESLKLGFSYRASRCYGGWWCFNGEMMFFSKMARSPKTTSRKAAEVLGDVNILRMKNMFF